MIERRALPQSLINFTTDADDVNTFDDPIDIKGDMQPIGSTTRLMQMFGLDSVPAKARIDFIPIRYTGDFSNNYLLGSGTGQSLILNGGQYYEVKQIAPWSKHYVVLLDPWTGAVPA